MKPTPKPNPPMSIFTAKAVLAFAIGALIGGATIGIVDRYFGQPLFSDAQIRGSAGAGAGVGAGGWNATGSGSTTGSGTGTWGTSGNSGGGVRSSTGAGSSGSAGTVKRTTKTTPTNTKTSTKASTTTSTTKTASTTPASTPAGNTNNPPATTSPSVASQPASTTTIVKNPGNLNKDTGETIDETGRSGFVICGNTVDTPCNITHLFRGMIIIINYLITMAGLVAILFIVISGLQIIGSQFGGDQAKLTQAKRKLGGAVGGLVLVALAFVLVNSLLAGSLNVGIKNGALILSNPKKYINQ